MAAVMAICLLLMFYLLRICTRFSALQQRCNVAELELARQQGKNRLVDTLQQQLQDRGDQLATLYTELQDCRDKETTAVVRLQEERRQSQEKLDLLGEARDQLAQQFKMVAREIFDERGKRLTEQNDQQLNQILSPFRQQLDGFRQKVDEIYVNDVRERASLKQELENLRLLNQRINDEAVQLSRALKGDHKVQGNWGELVLERVLEQSGLRKGVEYETQSGLRDADSRLFKPDVIVRLPEDKDVVIDSKVSLLAYERYCNSEDESQQADYLKQHIQAVRQHISSLSDKDYSRLQGLRSLDFVLMFMPIESAFVAAFQGDESLFNYAFERKIVVVTPTTLLATLRTIENIWRFERQNQNAQAIAERAGAVYDKLRGFVEDMEKLGVQLAGVDQSYSSAMNKLCQGRGNLISQASRFVDLGVKVRKPLPKSVMERAELEEGASVDDVSSLSDK
ncbi:MAG: DNA recombination protein RmuC [Desulfuromonas sp.]|nr:DNA recombination protein RmuC [Desulfuromonas sp.]